MINIQTSKLVFKRDVGYFYQNYGRDKIKLQLIFKTTSQTFIHQVYTNKDLRFTAMLGTFIKHYCNNKLLLQLQNYNQNFHI